VASTVDPDAEPPRFSVDARLPNPPIITCNEPLPLRVLVQKLSASKETVFLQMLQIELIGYTHVRAHELTRTETGSWVLMSKSNMAIPLGSPEDPEGKEWKVDNSMWNQIPLPNTVAPSFDTCNISRTYELEVRVGLAHGNVGAIKVSFPQYLPTTLLTLLTARTPHATPPNSGKSIFWDCSSTSTSPCHGHSTAYATSPTDVRVPSPAPPSILHDEPLHSRHTVIWCDTSSTRLLQRGTSDTGRCSTQLRRCHGRRDWACRRPSAGLQPPNYSSKFRKHRFWSRFEVK
jgi:hypothetical protein